MRQNSEIIPLPLTEGVFPNLNPWEVGARLRKAQNLVTSRFNRRFFTQPQVPTQALATINALEGLGITVYNNLPFLMTTKTGSSFFRLFRTDTGAEITAGGATDAVVTDPFTPAAGAYWRAQGTLYVGHPSINKLYTYTGGSTWSNYAPTNVPLNASAIKVHLNRLWFLEQATNGTTKLKYTDTNLPSTIRATNFEIIEDIGTALFRTTPSDVDLGATAHLGIGCKDSIWIYDGNPKLGNAVLRQLSNQVGIFANTLVVETDFGAVCLATDGEFYLIDRGATKLTPLGEPIRNKSARYIATGNPYNNWPSTLLWEEPLLYYFNGTMDAVYIMDFSLPSGPKWFGPMDTPIPWGGSQPRKMLGAVRIVAADGLDSLIVGERLNVGSLTGYAFSVPSLTQLIQTGFIYKPGHQSVLKRVVVESRGTASITVRGVSSRGDDVSVTQVTAANNSESIVKTVFVMDTIPVRGDYIFLEISGSGLTISDVIVEVRTIPRQD